MTTGAVSQNVDKLFSEFKLVPDNLFIYVEANWEATEIAILTQWPNYSVTLCTVLANCQDILCYFRCQIYLLTIAEWRLTWPHKSSWIMACNLISTVWHWSVLTLLWRLYSSLENYAISNCKEICYILDILWLIGHIKVGWFGQKGGLCTGLEFLTGY